MNTCLALFLLFTVIWLVRDHYLVIRRDGKRLRRPPGTLPFAGYGLWFLRPRYTLLQWLAHVQDDMGFETFELPVPSLPPAVLVNDPKILEQVLRDTSTFVKGHFFKARSEDLFRNGILNADGELWKVQRKAGLRFLSVSNLEWFIDSILPPLLDNTMARLKTAAESREVVDLQECLLDLTTRFMGKIAYDMDLTSEMSFSKAFELASAETGYRFTNPLWKIKRQVFGTPFAEAVREIHAFGASIVDAARKESQQDSTDGIGKERSDQFPRVNLIQSLLNNISSTETVAAAAMNYLSAGRDTTAQSMTWTIYHLIRNPQALNRLRLSLSAYSPRDENLSFKGLKDNQQAPYFSAVFAESLRLSPPIPLEIKETTKKVLLQDGTVLPNGAVVVWCPFAMARNHRIWGSDAKDFRPERWLDCVSNTVSYKFEVGEERERQYTKDPSNMIFASSLKTPFEYPVFNAGPRSCIGQQLAESLAAVTVCKIMCSFNIEPDWSPDGNVSERSGQDGLTMPVLHGLPIRLSVKGA